MTDRTRDVAQVLSVLKAGRWLLLALVLVASAFAYANSLTQPERFRASAQLLFGRTTPADTVAGAGAAAAGDPAREAATTLALASLDRVAVRTRRQFSGPVTVDALKNAVHVTATGNSDLLTVTAEWSTPAQAAALANAFADSIVALRRQTAQSEIQRSIDAVNATLGSTRAAAPTGPDAGEARALRDRVGRLRVLEALQTGDVQIVQRAGPPAGPSSPRPVRDAVLAGLLALLLGVGLLLLRSRLDGRLRGEEDLASLIPAPILARVPETRRSPLRNLAAAAHDQSFVEAFEFLRLNLQLMEVSGSARGRREPAHASRSRDERGRFAGSAAPEDGRRLVLAVTSPVASSGKTTTLCWLARSLAAGGEHLAAVDLDLRNPTLHRFFGVDDEGSAAVTVALDRDEHAGHTRGARGELRLLSGEDTSLPRPDVTGRHGALGTMLQRLRNDADYVLVDTSPVATVAHASAVAAAADGVILVIDVGRTRRKDVIAAKRQLDNAHAHVLGIVLNRASDAPQSYHADPVPAPATHTLTA
jgi:non-specific protein-tyrosine kinase